MKKFIVLLIVLAMTAPGLAATSGYASLDQASVPGAWDVAASTSTLYSWAGAPSMTGAGGNGYGYPAGNSAYAGCLNKNATAGQLYFHNYNHATQPMASFSGPGSISMWLAPNWNGENQGGSHPNGTYGGTAITYGASEWAGPMNLFLFDNNYGPTPGWQWIFHYDGGGGGASNPENYAVGNTMDWTIGSWHHILVTWDNTNISVGIDGLEFVTLPLGPTPALPAGGYYTGRASGPWFDGWVDDIVLDMGAYVPMVGGAYTMPSNPGEIPEPATIALLGLGALALLRKRS